MVDRLEGKVAVVTGGASGIGLAVVERFIAEGASVVFCDLTPEGGRSTNEKLGAALHHGRRESGGANDGHGIEKRLGERAAFVPADVTNEEQMSSVFETATSRFGGLDIDFARSSYCIAQGGG